MNRQKKIISILFIIFWIFPYLSFAQLPGSFKPIDGGGAPTQTPEDLSSPSKKDASKKDSDETFSKIEQRLKELREEIKIYDAFIKGAGEYNTLAAEISQGYSNFLKQIENLQAKCDVQKKYLEQKKSRKGAKFLNLLEERCRRCEKDVTAQKNYAQELGKDIDGIIDTAKQANEMAKFHIEGKEMALGQIRNLELNERLEKMNNSLKEKERELTKTDKGS
jgi:hypothetical protein